MRWDGAISLVRRYPLAALAAVGLATGLVARPFSAGVSRAAFAASTVAVGLPLVARVVARLFRGKLYADVIAALAIVGSLLLGEYLAGAVVVLMQSGGEALEDYGLRRAQRSLENLLRRAPSVAHVVSDGTVVDQPARDVAVGAVVLVRTGDIIPADGVVTEGEGAVDESALTGEPVPLPKRPGDRVYSGTISLAGQFRLRTARPAAESRYERIVRMVQNAQGERAPINRLANRYAPYFTAIALAIAGLALVWQRDATAALAVLVVATPCPLIIATPIAVLSAVDRAAAMNVIVKSGAAIERAADVRTVVFDKTGTLTVGEPRLVAVEPLRGDAPHEDELLAAAAAIELLSTHGMAAAVVNAARARGLALVPAEAYREQPGAGAEGNVGGRRYAVGSAAFVGVAGTEAVEPGAALAWIARDGLPVARLRFRDELRPEAPNLVRRLREEGIERQVMMTGDAPAVAEAIASQAGVGEVHARLLPEEKLALLGELEAAAPTMMVGDGINDAPALAAADVGVAMGGHGAGIATDAADVVITVENVERVADVVAIGKRMVHVARQGILGGMGASIVLMLIASAGFIPPAAGAVLQELVDLATILNALRAR